MKILSKVLYAILGLIIAICLLILLCSANPDIADAVAGVTKGLVPVKDAPADEHEEAESAAVSAVVSIDEPEDEPEEAAEETVPNTYDDYSNKRDLTDVVDMGVVGDYGTSDESDPYKKLIDDGLDDDVFEDDYFRQFVDKNDYVVTEPEVYDIADETEAQEITDSTGIGESGEGEEFDPLYYPYYQMLNDKGKALYRQIYANSNALIDEFKPVNECTPKEWCAAFDCVFYDHPELFWMDISKYYEYDFKGNVIKVKLDFYKEIPDVESAKTRFNSSAESIIAGASGLDSEYEKEKYIHDLLVDKITYQHNSMDQSSFSSVPNDYTVCCGYAKAFQYLMQMLEVPTYFCVGWGGEMHAWNIIKLEDDYYNVDCTWDDSDPSTYDFFNVTDRNNVMHSRIYQSRYLPPCNGTKYGGLEKKEIKPSDYDAATDKVYTNYIEYTSDFLKVVVDNYSEGKTDTDVKLIISQEMFMDWYILNFDNRERVGESDIQYYEGDNYTFTLAYSRLSSGDYLITHIVHFEQ